jgi:hypothetical protein
MAGGYYYLVNKGRKRVMYGPFSNADDAEYASYFAQSEDGVTGPHSATPYEKFPFSVAFYDENEVEAILDDPSWVGMTSVEVKRPSTLKMHKSWRDLFNEYPDEGSLSEQAKRVYARFLRSR